AGEGRIVSPMPGLLAELLVEPGAAVGAGDPVAVVEAMKMRHRVAAPSAGVVTRVHAAAGDQLGRGDAIATIEAAE
ncbi:MAG: acetyl-CoA carboxylase biotin carboxyl carrier protein subunit, partial [Pseudomonadota bacterium]